MKTNTLDNLDTVSFRPQDALSMGAQLHGILRSAIVCGDLVPGQAISEIEISKRFSISRQPVREAFIMLGQEKLIEVRPHRGTFIRAISVKEVLDARYVREVIEVAIVREIAKKADDALLKKLRKTIVLQAKVKSGDSRTFLDLDDRFHQLLAMHAGREYAWQVTEGIKAQMGRVRYLSYEFATPKPILVNEHSEIVDAIELGDPDLAAHKMESHLREIIASLPLIAARYPEHFSA